MFYKNSKIHFLQRKEVNKYYLLKKNLDNNKIDNNKKKVIFIRIISWLLLFLFGFFILSKMIVKKPKKKEIKIKPKLKIGVMSVYHEINVGNNLVKYSISIILKELGFIPYIVGTHFRNYNISFLNKTTNLIVLKNSFNEIKRDDFDILMVNSDQTWRKLDNNFLDYGFLKFAKDWKIKKFAYAPSLGHNYWEMSPENTMIAKELLKNFTGISIREKNSIDLVKKHLGVTPEFVLDPTLLIDKQYYLDLIKNYTKNEIIEENYIFVYQISRDIYLERYIYKASRQLNYKVYEFKLKNEVPIEDFIYYISNCKAVLTNSFHGTVFSIIFNKPFISFSKKQNAEARLQSLGEVFDLRKRIIFSYDKEPDTSLLTMPLNLNQSLIESLRTKSINFIKKNLDLI